MKVTVKWMFKNPFSPDGIPTCSSEAELPDETSFEEIEQYAKEATPDGYFLKYIYLPDESYQYFINGTRKQIKP